MMRTLLVLGVCLAACGDNLPGAPDDAPPAGSVCGNGVLEPGEDCDDGNNVADAECDAACRFTCGNGVIDTQFGEICDTGIASGAGACPASCDDAQACTTDVLSGSGCEAECVHAPITAAVDGDGCCPAGANANTDSDCEAMCGNGIVEAGELCDTGIVAGIGACPTSCDDLQACTTDTLLNDGSCMAACSFTPITAPADGDGCCPPGATALTDDDCSADCGNGVVEPGETCDTDIVAGPGACPTACADGDACTTDVLSNPGTCTAACAFPPVTMAINGDGCCPPGANANNDSDCAPVCPNGVVEPGEQCDDNNMIDDDDCSNTCQSNVVTAFRMNTLVLRDPHVFARVVLCIDGTALAVNNPLQDSLTMDLDSPPDGLLDLSPTLVFRGLSQTSNAMMPVDLHFADCTAPASSTTCAPSTTAPISATATNLPSGACLGVLPGTVRPYSPAVTPSAQPCFVSSATTVTIELSGIPITLRDAQIAATYVGAPATSMVNGLLRGFITETDANATILPANLQFVGGQPLSSVLPGGAGNCSSTSDKDTHGGLSGWWFYLNFTAARVPWTGN